MHTSPSWAHDICNRRLSKKYLMVLEVQNCWTAEIIFKMKRCHNSVTVLWRRGGREVCIMGPVNWIFHPFQFYLGTRRNNGPISMAGKNYLNAICLSSVKFKWFVIHLDERYYRAVKSLSSLWQRIIVLHRVWMMNEKTACWFVVEVLQMVPQ